MPLFSDEECHASFAFFIEVHLLSNGKDSLVLHDSSEIVL